MFYLNKTSSESTFSESQIYENINRIVKLINYSPVGAQTPTLTFSCSASNTLGIGSYTIPRYTFIRVNNSSYNFNKDISFSKTLSGEQALDSVGGQTLLYQGKWTEYPLYTAQGINNETVFVAPGSGVIIDHFNIDVYVKSIETGKWEQWERVDTLYLENATSKKYEVRYNETRNYEIKFGDDINGKRINTNDLVAVYYLQSLGTDGEVGAEDIANLPAVVYNTAQFNQIKADVFSTDLTYLDDTNLNTLSFNNSNPSTIYNAPESVESIRKNAPGSFRSQYRLVTAPDFEREAKALFETKVNDKQVYDIITGIYPKPEKDTKGQFKKWENKISLVNDLYFDSPTNANIKGTAWGMFNALTERIDYFKQERKNNSENRLASASGFDAMQNAEKNTNMVNRQS